MNKTICITNGHLTDDLIEQIGGALEEGCKMLILREDDMAGAEYEQLAIGAIDMCREHEAKCIIDSRRDVAMSLNHPHIHLSYDDFCALSDEECVAFKSIGVSASSVSEAEECEELGASYITVDSDIELIKDIKESVFIPVYELVGAEHNNVHADDPRSALISAISQADRDTLVNIKIVVTGAGKLGEPIARYLEDAGIINVEIINRTQG